MRSKHIVSWGAPALVAAALLPIYPRLSLVRSQVVGHAGDSITWKYSLSTLPALVTDLQYMGPEEHAMLTVALDVLLWFTITGALMIALLRAWQRVRTKTR